MFKLPVKKRRVEILIADDQEVIRKGVRAILKTSKSNFTFSIEEYPDTIPFSGHLNLRKFDLLIIDGKGGDDHLVSAVFSIRENNPKTGIIVLSDSRDVGFAYKVIMAGANGFLLKDLKSHQLLSAIQSVIDGGSYCSNELAVPLLTFSSKREPAGSGTKYGLTKREQEIVKFIAQGMTNDEIAGKLYISKRTVDTHRQNILHKLNAKNTVGIVRVAYELKLI